VKPIPIYAERLRKVLEPLARGIQLSIDFLEDGPEAVETLRDEVFVAPLVVKKVEELWRSGFDGVLINCFDDPGLEASRESVPIPVVGAGQASLLVTQILGSTFSIITVGGLESVRATRRMVERYGFSHKLVSIRSVGVHPQDIDLYGDGIVNRVVELCRKALMEDGADVVILGCTALTPIYPKIARLLGSNRVVDPTLCGFMLLHALVLHNALLRGEAPC